MKRMNLSRKLHAFTLTELLIVLVIIGILVLLALPDHSSVISKAKASEAKLQLKHLHSLQKTYFYEHSKYAKSLEDIGFEQKELSTEGGSANYKIMIEEASASGFKAVAKAVVDFDQDGNFNVWKVDEDMNLEEEQKD